MGAILASAAGLNAFLRGGAASPLAAWNTALSNRGTTPARYLLMGDSLTEGQGASTRALRWQDRMHTALLGNYSLTGGAGLLQPAYGVYAPDSTWSQWQTASTGTITYDVTTGQAASWGLHRVRVANTATITYTFFGTGVDVWWLGGTGAGATTYQIDGGGSTAITPGTTGTLVASRTQISGLSAASHTIKFTGTTANPFMLIGLMIYNGDAAAGLQKYDSGSTSAAASHYAGFNPQFTTMVQLAAPDLVMLGLGGNDAGVVTASTFQSQMAGLITSLQGMTKAPSIILVICPQISGTSYVEPWANYRTAIFNLGTTYNCNVVDLTAQGFPTTDTSGTGLYRTDGIHFNDSGQAKMASVAGAALGHMVPITTPSISGSTTVGSVLTATAGTFQNTADTTTYQWLKNGATISGQTGSTYTIVSGDIGAAITCTITNTKSGYVSSITGSNAITATSSGLFSETFPGASGAAWPTGWTSFVAGAGTVQQAGSNVGRMLAGTASYTVQSMVYRNDTSVADIDLTFDLAFNSPTTEQYLNIALRSNTPTATTSVTLGYYIQFFPGAGANSGGINYNSGAGETSLSGDLAFGAFTAGVYKRFRFQVTGTTIRVKTWTPGGAEPGSWLYTGTNSAITAAGRVQFTHSTGAAGTAVQALFQNISAV